MKLYSPLTEIHRGPILLILIIFLGSLLIGSLTCLGCVSRKHRMMFLRRRCVANTSPSQNFVSRRHRLLFCCSQSPNCMRPQQSRRKGNIPIAKCHSVRKMTALRNIPIRERPFDFQGGGGVWSGWNIFFTCFQRQIFLSAP